MNDDLKFKKFFKENYPKAPEASPFEFKKIMNAVRHDRNDEGVLNRFFKNLQKSYLKIAVSTAMATILTGGVLIHYSEKNKTEAWINESFEYYDQGFDHDLE